MKSSAMKRHGWLAAAPLLLLAAGPGFAGTSNGNDFALTFSEAATDAERAAVLDEARGRPHYFRYLRIVCLEEGEKDGRPYVAVDAVEPSSLMRVTFSVTRPVSLRKMQDEPRSGTGDAVAVTGKVTDADRERNTITLGEVIVRHKDRLAPKVGKELLGEVNPDAVYYMFTYGKRPIKVRYRDRDLLESKDKIIAEQGKQGWADFLEARLAERAGERAKSKTP